MSRILIDNLTFGYGGAENVFDHVAFQIDTDWKLGLIGRNGKGKTTLLKILKGELEYRGIVSSSVGFDYFPFEVADAARSVREVAAEIAPDAAEWERENERGRLGLEESVSDRNFDTLSGGERTKVLLAALFLRENRYLLLDEPTNHLDAHGRKTLAGYLSRKRGFLVVSHDRAFLDACTDHILAINKRSIECMPGNYSVWRADKDRRNAAEYTANERLGKDIARLSEANRRTADWSDRAERTKIGNGPCDRGYVGHKAAKMMKRAKSIEKRRDDAIAEKTGLLADLEETENLEMFPLLCVAERLLSCKEVEFSYDGAAKISLDTDILRGERVALLGGNGCGKTTALKLLAGELKPLKGTVAAASGLVVSYVPQTAEHLIGTPYELATEYGVERGRLFAVLMRFGFKRELFARDAKDYSDGQKKKLLLALSLVSSAHLYIWDEPLNWLDIDSREQIERVLLKSGATLVFVEHDAAFARNVATREIRLDLDHSETKRSL